METLKQTILTQNYEDYRKLVYHRCHRFSRWTGYRASTDDLSGIAHEAFLRAITMFTEDRGRFDSYLCLCIDRALKDWWKKWDRLKPVRLGHPIEANDEINLCRDVSLDELSERAREVVRLALELKGRKKVYRQLRQQGWTTVVIARCFDEVREALR